MAGLEASTLPILRNSRETIEDLGQSEDAVDARMLADALAGDPLLAVKVYAHLAELRRGREGTEAETLRQALVMLGIGPFFRAFGAQACAEDTLAEQPEALSGFEAVLERGRRAARFALAFAVQRMDHDTALLYECALLHDFAELLAWLRAPALMLEIARRQHADSGLRSAAAQIALLGIRVSDLQQALMQAWRLPRTLVMLADANLEATNTQARTVLLAIRLARHTAQGWNNAALDDDVRDIAALLHMAPGPTLALLQDVDES